MGQKPVGLPRPSPPGGGLSGERRVQAILTPSAFLSSLSFLPVLPPQGLDSRKESRVCSGFQEQCRQYPGLSGRECPVPPGTPKTKRGPRENSRLQKPWAL